MPTSPPHLLPFRRGRCPRSEASTLGVHRPAVSPPHPLRCSVGADDPVRPNTAQRCHSEPVLAAKQVPLGCTLAWESVPLFMSSSGPWPPPTFAASRQRRDLIIASPKGEVSKGEGAYRPKAIGKEDSVKETHQGFLSRSVRKPIFALQKS